MSIVDATLCRDAGHAPSCPATWEKSYYGKRRMEPCSCPCHKTTERRSLEGMADTYSSDHLIAQVAVIEHFPAVQTGYRRTEAISILKARLPHHSGAMPEFFMYSLRPEDAEFYRVGESVVICPQGLVSNRSFIPA